MSLSNNAIVSNQNAPNAASTTAAASATGLPFHMPASHHPDDDDDDNHNHHRIHHPSRAQQLIGIPSPVMDLLVGSGTTSDHHQTSSLPPIVPSFKIKVGQKMVDSRKATRKWKWDSFHSSARNDDQAFSHWVRAGVEYPDYPYARFDVHLETVLYNHDEYMQFLQDPLWTKSETDKLMDVARIHELRWVVIHDRWQDCFPPRPMEDLMYRYYRVAALLAQERIQKEAATEVDALTSMEPSDPHTVDHHLFEIAAARALATCDPQQQPLISTIGTGATNKNVFQLEKERDRRAHLNFIWNRSKEEELEEEELRKELALIETQLRKLKKTGWNPIPSRTVSPMPTMAESTAMLHQSFAMSAPTPMPGTSYLQSARQVPLPLSAGINKQTLKRMDSVLEEFHLGKKPLPTKRNCDMYDSVRKDILILVTLQKMVLQREGILQTKELRLAKLGGGRWTDEEALLGIAPAAVVPTVVPPVQASRKPKTKPSARLSNSVGKGGKPIPQKVVVKATTEVETVSAGIVIGVNAGSKAIKKPSIAKRKKKSADIKGGSITSAPIVLAVAATSNTSTDPGASTPLVGVVPGTVLVPASRTSSSALPEMGGEDSKPNSKKRARKGAA